MIMSNEKVWFITGSSRGFGRVWTEAALKRGDKVVATARNPAVLQPLVASYGDRILPLALDCGFRFIRPGIPIPIRPPVPIRFRPSIPS